MGSGEESLAAQSLVVEEYVGKVVRVAAIGHFEKKSCYGEPPRIVLVRGDGQGSVVVVLSRAAVRILLMAALVAARGDA